MSDVSSKKPEWLKVRYNPALTAEVAGIMKELGLNTVCTGASCPNIGECYRRHTATFMILGTKCTRNCRFCDIDHAKCASELMPPDPDEPRRLAEAAKRLGLKHVVVTCVTRDDLPDGGASSFAETIRAIKKLSPSTTVEVLISDMKGSHSSLDVIMEAKPDVLNHNLETVPSLYRDIRPQAIYERSLDVLRYCKTYGAITKTGIMLGLGETDDEIKSVMNDVAKAGCDILVISQYLRPSENHAPLTRWVTPEQFEGYKQMALESGIRYAVSAPLVRSSYMAADAFEAVK